VVVLHLQLPDLRWSAPPPAGTRRGWTAVVSRAPVAAVALAAPSSVAVPAARPHALALMRPHVPDDSAVSAEAVPNR
jgi:hypothetical protein